MNGRPLMRFIAPTRYAILWVLVLTHLIYLLKDKKAKFHFS